MEPGKSNPVCIENGNAVVEPTYEKPEIVVLGDATEITRNSNSGPFVDGTQDDNYRWKQG